MTKRAEIHHQHRSVTGGWLRPAVFGMMDGLVSNFALIAGVAGAKADSTAVSLAGLAGLVGGAFSMATGEYVSVQSQNESANAEIEIERRELRVNAAAEQAELAQSYVDRGVEPGLANQVAEQISRDPDEALSVHAMAEFGVNPSELPSPWTAAGSSFASFTVGAVIPLLPYLVGATSLLISAGAVARRAVRRWGADGAIHQPQLDLLRNSPSPARHVRRCGDVRGRQSVRRGHRLT